MSPNLAKMRASISTSVERRLFTEYGAIFATSATPPPVIIFSDTDHVRAFQASLEQRQGVFGEHQVTLQTKALESLSNAAGEIERAGSSLSARAADAGGRSYEDTVRLWTRNVIRGLEHWQTLGRIGAEVARSIRDLPSRDQIAPVLDLEDSEQIYFGTFFDRSILYSVAAPGASQHLSLLAFDVAEYQDEEVEQTLGRHGWYRTVPNDLPHFTYLGVSAEALPKLGLNRLSLRFGERVYHFWTPDADQ